MNRELALGLFAVLAVLVYIRQREGGGAHVIVPVDEPSSVSWHDNGLALVPSRG